MHIKFHQILLMTINASEVHSISLFQIFSNPPSRAMFAGALHPRLGAGSPLTPTWPAVAVAGGALLLAKGFGKRKENAGIPGGRRQYRLKGKLIGCEHCQGKGKKPCVICKGSKTMTGFMGSTVPCVPCGGSGFTGRPCAECDGLGFFQAGK